jgi:hypothetical protein
MADKPHGSSEGEDDAPGVYMVNVIWRGRTHVDLWGTDFGLPMLGIKHGGRLVHNLWGIGLSPRRDTLIHAASYGFGVRLHEAKHVYVDIDALLYGLIARNPETERWSWTVIQQLRVPIGLRLTKHVALFAAPTLSVSFVDHPFLDDLAWFGSFEVQPSDWDQTIRIWPGLSIGLQLL